MTVPERLRDHQQLQQNLRHNSLRLITHFDLYATFIDIAKYASKDKWNNFDAIDWRSIDETKNHGESVLRSINSIRNCKTLRIPISYCLCQYESIEIDRPQDDQISVNGAAFITNYLNEYLNKRKFQHICATLSPLQIIKSEKIIVDNALLPNSVIVLRISFSVSPSNGSFEGYVSLSANGTYRMVAPDVTRTNSYGRQSYCTRISNIRPFCYCRTLINESSTIALVS